MIRFALVLLMSLAGSSQAIAAVKWNNPGQKKQNEFVYHQQVDKDYPYQISEDVARLGKKSQRFELRHGDCEVISKVQKDQAFNKRLSDFHCSTFRERVQVGSKDWKPGDDMWWGISVYLPKDFKPDTNNICTMLMQIKQYENDAPDMEVTETEPFIKKTQPGGFAQSRYKYALGHGVFGIGICGGEVGICVNKTWGPKMDTNYRCLNKVIGDMNRFRDSWVDFAFHYDTRNYKNGKSLLEIWVNGEKVGRYANVTEHFPDTYRAQFGLYRSQFQGKENGPKSTLVAYFDESRYGRNYNEVAPQEQKEAID